LSSNIVYFLLFYEKQNHLKYDMRTCAVFTSLQADGNGISFLIHY